jgi:hypothetical protein
MLSTGLSIGLWFTQTRSQESGVRLWVWEGVYGRILLSSCLET